MGQQTTPRNRNRLKTAPVIVNKIQWEVDEMDTMQEARGVYAATVRKSVEWFGGNGLGERS